MSRPDWRREGKDWPNRDASRFVRAGGVEWHVQVMGPKVTGAPVLLMLHGTGAATHSWRDLAPLLARHFTLVAPDLPGHGFTNAPGGGPTLPGAARGVRALLDALALEPVMALGHSAGAAIAIRMTLDGLIAPRAIVGVNAALLPFPGVAAKLFPALAKLFFLNPLTPKLFAMQARMEGEVERFLKRSTASDLDAAGVDLYARLFAHSAHVDGALGMMANWDLETLAADLPRLPAPLTLIVGGGDPAVAPAKAEEAARLAPEVEVVTLPGLGHLAHEETPEKIAEIVERVARERAILA